MSTVSNYYYSPSTITRLLHKAVDTVGANIGCYCKSPGIDFTRKRKISFSDIVFMLMERSDRVRLGESPNQLVTIGRTTNRPNVRTHNESCERRNVAQSVRDYAGKWRKRKWLVSQV